MTRPKTPLTGDHPKIVQFPRLSETCPRAISHPCTTQIAKWRAAAQATARQRSATLSPWLRLKMRCTPPITSRLRRGRERQSPS